jgi:hypothetical protein
LYPNQVSIIVFLLTKFSFVYTRSEKFLLCCGVSFTIWNDCTGRKPREDEWKKVQDQKEDWKKKSEDFLKKVAAAPQAPVSVANPGCLSRIRIFFIPDPNFSHLGSRIRIKEFKYINSKNVSKVSEIC